ncbi:hypothetical protein WJX72_006262 [[Myrmecia] bisecta]|uniref:Phosphatidate cytidylyltransferase, mitochondrial n=1 Tax=[Myrmecia] bisecta TaxID=41462 RepID=A0AAW1PHE5_9CHLO
MLDFIMAVDDPSEWHAQNIQANRQHYSQLASLGGRAVACHADCVGVGVHFNTTVPWRNQVIKYGVISKDRMCSDLLKWDSLYVSGRMHKPILTLQPDEAVANAAKCNLQSAVAVSLLLLPEQFTIQELYRQICGLSYLGDVRMGIAEDSRKVDRIVEGSLDGFRDLYAAPLQGEVAQQAGLARVHDDAWGQVVGQEARQRVLETLPKGVMLQLASAVSIPTTADALTPEVSAKVAEAVIATGRHQQLLSSAVANIVRASSRRQAVAGFLMAGPVRSCAYVWQKLLKSWRSRQVKPQLM